jgi:hypothetical protein
MTTTQVRGRQLKQGWDDLQGDVSQGRVPASNYPSWTTWNYGIGGGIEFAVLGFGVNEYLDFYYQSSHSMELLTELSDHIHWSVPSNDAGKKFKFQLDVIAAGVNEAFAVTAGSPYTVEVTLGAAEAGYHRLGEFPSDIPGVNTTTSTLYVCRLKRIAASSNEYGSDVYIIYHDAHYIKDQIGSEEEFIK